ncbi:MAG: hypothetical protein U0Q19_06735 [Kineosporiaceae bacterium]
MAETGLVLTADPVPLVTGEPDVGGPAPATTVHGRRLRRDALWLMLSSGTSAVLGMLYWVVAGNRYTQEQFGRDGAVITAMLGVSALGQLNLPLALLRLLPAVTRRRGRVLAVAMTATVVASLVIAGLALALFRDHVSGLEAAGRNGLVELAFTLGAALWSVSVALDSIFVALQRSRWVPLKNVGFSVVKIVLAYLLVGAVGGWGIFASWLVGTAAIVVPFGAIAVGVVRRAAPADAPSIFLAGKGRARLASMLGQDYLASVVGQAYAQFVPMLVLITAGVAGSASFVVPFSATMAIDTLALSGVFALTAGASRHEAHLVALTRTAARQVSLIVGGAAAVCLVAAPVLLLPFGVGGGAASIGILRVLVIGSLFRSVLAMYEALCRIWGRTDLILFFQLLVGVPMMALGWYAGQRGGAAAVAWCWVGVHAVAALTMTPLVVRLWRRQLVVEKHV